MDESSLPPAVNARLQSLLHSFDFAFVVSDCSQADMPIVFASSKFYDMTGYSPDEVCVTLGLQARWCCLLLLSQAHAASAFSCQPFTADSPCLVRHNVLPSW
jgi:PAS domain-containing protein